MMKRLKKLVAYYFPIFAGIIIMSCNDDNEAVTSIDNETVEAEVLLDASFEDIDDLVTLSMAATDGPGEGRIARRNDDRLSCAVVTHNADTQTIIIDFGDGCEDPRGRVRAGRIIITYSGRRFLPGSVITTTLENFSVDSIQIEGTRKVTNITEITGDLLGMPKFNITLTGGKMTWPDGNFATREVDKVRTWVRALNPLDDELHLDGTANGINRRGEEYSMIITETLVFKRSCVLDITRVFIPVDGIKQITKGDQVFTIDFGDGGCDNIITVTNGITTVDIDLSSGG